MLFSTGLGAPGKVLVMPFMTKLYWAAIGALSFCFCFWSNGCAPGRTERPGIVRFPKAAGRDWQTAVAPLGRIPMKKLVLFSLALPSLAFAQPADDQAARLRDQA